MPRPLRIPVRFGPAGWSYPDWQGVVFPKPKPRGFDPLAYLARYFGTVEINSTFYRPVAPKIAADWAARVAKHERFRFTAKLWRRFTHERDETWTRDEVKQTTEGFRALLDAGRLGAVLVQFPWSFKRTDENREWLDDVLTAFLAFPLVLEVRHASWDTPELYQALHAQGVGFVNVDQPLFHDSLRPSARATAPVGYIRVHGRNYKNWFRKTAGRDERFDYLYTARELEPWAARTRQLAEKSEAKELYVVTNNHFRGKAPANALMLQSMVDGHPVEAPPELVAAYPDALGPFVVKGAPDR